MQHNQHGKHDAMRWHTGNGCGCAASQAGQTNQTGQSVPHGGIDLYLFVVQRPGGQHGGADAAVWFVRHEKQTGQPAVQPGV